MTPAVEPASVTVTRAYDAKAAGEHGAIPVNLPAQALSRRLKQLEELGQDELDLVMAPRLQRCDLGILVQVRREPLGGRGWNGPWER